jgi:hypothetical protein
MAIIIPLILFVVCLVLAWLSKSPLIRRVLWINVVIIYTYNLVGWMYLFGYFGPVGVSIGEFLQAGFLLYFATPVHLAALTIVMAAMAYYRYEKDQQKHRQPGR